MTTALAASPLGVVAILVALLAILGVGPKIIRLPAPAWIIGIGSEWVFELFRFHIL
jgi:hypothetical protein